MENKLSVRLYVPFDCFWSRQFLKGYSKKIMTWSCHPFIKWEVIHEMDAKVKKSTPYMRINQQEVYSANEGLRMIPSLLVPFYTQYFSNLSFSTMIPLPILHLVAEYTV